MNRCRVIGIVGTAKNTGKTTTLSYLLKNFKDKRVCVTGIGYDGEQIDNITNLPKPRLFLLPGLTAYTSEQCLRGASNQIKILERTGDQTPLGEIVKVEILEPGYLVIAGPNKLSGIEKIISNNRNNFDLIFIDGSLNRLSPLAAADEIIFTTGASRNEDPETLSEEMRAVEKIFSFPIIDSDKVFNEAGHLVDEADAERIKKEINKGEIYFKAEKMLSYNFLKLMAKFLMREKELIFHLNLPTPLSLLLAGDPIQIISSLDRSSQIKISYQKRINLKAVTINPFYPKLDGNTYGEAYINKNILMEKMKEKLKVPVYNIKENGKEFLELMA